MINQNALKDKLTGICDHWQYQGHVFVSNKDSVLYTKAHGLENQKNQTLTGLDTPFTLDANDRFFVGLAILHLVSQGHMSLDQTLDSLIPEYQHASQVRLRHLLCNRSGIEDYYHNHLMVELENDPSYHTKSLQERRWLEHQVKHEVYGLDQVLAMIGNQPLVYQPGDYEGNESDTNAFFMAEIIKRVSGLDPLSYLVKHIFKPLGMDQVKLKPNTHIPSYIECHQTQLVEMPSDFKASSLFTVTLEDAKKLSKGLVDQVLFTQEIWKAILAYDKAGRGLLFEDANGYDCISTQFLGFGFYFYMNRHSDIAFFMLSQAQQTFEMVDNSWNYIRKEMRLAVSEYTLFPKDTQMVPLNERNFWHALTLGVHDDQKGFVLDAKTSVAMSLMYPTKQAYLQVEGSQVVGLLVLNIDQDKEDFDIDIITIDKRFQGRGYGKLMVEWAVNHLKNQGAKKLTIGVSRLNIGAKKIYMNAGFQPNSVYEGGMQLSMTIG